MKTEVVILTRKLNDKTGSLNKWLLQLISKSRLYGSMKIEHFK
jgi:hypothetical protein